MRKKLKIIWKILKGKKYLAFVRKGDKWFYDWSEMNVLEAKAMVVVLNHAIEVGKQEHANVNAVKEIITPK